MGETREEGPELFDLRMSEGAQPLYERVVRFLEEVVAPMQEEYFRLGEGRADPWNFEPGQLEVLDGAKAQALEAGLWNRSEEHTPEHQSLMRISYAAYCL